ncbi:probable protein phosphatase 2C 63 [Olea europaea var. sylvestris]|uniref:probable protein phosphatase 2C 63 n=1 Tax=Olea europaea var. sylvestris TaxID=158386 RepID=UPI000C1CDFE8|nr:probable protein phosphatase 2C 63 [Olea europaea var. sylvestris]
MTKYFPQSPRDWREAEFLQLKQGNMSLDEYERKFEQLSRYATHLVDIEPKKEGHFAPDCKAYPPKEDNEQGKKVKVEVFAFTQEEVAEDPNVMTDSGATHSFIFTAFIVKSFYNFQVSRSIGDVYLKKPDFNRDPLFLQFGNPVPLKRPLLTAEPSIVTRKLRPQDLFLIFASDGLWEHLSDEAAVDIVYKYPRAGIAKILVRAAIHEAAKKREVRYKDIRKIEKEGRHHFHDDITVIVIYLDHDHRKSPKHEQGSVGITSAPVDIFSYNSDEIEENPVDKIFPNEESRHILAVS